MMSDHLQTLKISNAARSEKSTFGRLLQLYLHDFSEFAGIEDPYGDVDHDGKFQYEQFDCYWVDPRREPLLFRLESQIVGFALVNDWTASGMATDYCMAEFFILRKYRRTGIGKSAAQEIIRRFPGTWEIPVADYNKPALHFWRSVVSSMTEYSIEEVAGDGERWFGTIWRLASGNNLR